MKTIIYTLIGIVLATITACKSPKTAQQSKQELMHIVELINNDKINIVIDRAYPLNTAALNQVANKLLIPTGNSANAIDLNGGNYTMTIDSTHVASDLPYYGERQQSTGYNDNSGIIFSGKPKNYTQSLLLDKSYIEVSYAISNSTENYDVAIEIYSLDYVTVNISSSHRTSIRYSGSIKTIDSNNQ